MGVGVFHERGAPVVFKVLSLKDIQSGCLELPGVVATFSCEDFLGWGFPKLRVQAAVERIWHK